MPIDKIPRDNYSKTQSRNGPISNVNYPLKNKRTTLNQKPHPLKNIQINCKKKNKKNKYAIVHCYSNIISLTRLWSQTLELPAFFGKGVENTIMESALPALPEFDF